MKSSAASSTVRAIGPTCASVVVADTGHTGMRPNCPLMVARPVKQPGMRTEPPPSVPSANGVTPAATEAAAPALEPPGVFPRFHGLRVMPVSGLSPTALQPNSLVVVLPINDRAGALDTLDRRRVGRSDVVRHGARAERIGLAADRDHILDRNRNAVQRPERITMHHRVLGGLRRSHRLVGHQQEERIERRLRRLRLVERATRHLDRRDFAPCDPPAQLDRGHPDRIRNAAAAMSTEGLKAIQDRSVIQQNRWGGR